MYIFPLEQVRQDTPACDNLIHFNNAGSSLMPQPVLDRVLEHLRLESQIGGYESADLMRDQLAHVYTSIAHLIGANSDEIALVENATRAWDMAFYAINFQPGDRILTAKSEYFSNYIAYLQIAKKTGAVIDVIPNDEYGQVSVSALREM
ncbi:MAG TPA: aminotransferase class V-fold PLP-dependent enzyme, partial [Anaerolineae bacterium]|nr:aminotransferase class V-fold PLP-dependent enzyme [Anaerolineae bacterium]